MRIPTIVLLSSVALSLLVTAETTPPAAAAAIAPISANVAAPADTTQPKDMEALSSLKMKEDGKTYPVGKGIVFTKTTFVVDDKNKDTSATKDEAEFSVQGLLDDLLGIDINLGGGSGKKKKKKDPPSDSGSTTPPAEETDPDYIPLFGDDGYKPRPVPKGCPELVFLDQMVWDQQGNNGSIEGPASTTPPVSPPADASASSPSESEADKNDSEIEKRDAPAAAAEDKSNKATTTEPKDKDEKEKLITKINTSAVTVIDPKDLSNDKALKKVDPKGIRICLLGGCSKDDEDEDEDNDDKPKRRRVRHKQKKFLRQFQGKALKIDGRTGCPIPSMA
ncbi:hypothetical protein BGX30_010102 [Mortierella sp. GBA39]|nr:hypothetical protein BGX30_010102 [Mortierella sp. GBA39]